MKKLLVTIVIVGGFILYSLMYAHASQVGSTTNGASLSTPVAGTTVIAGTTAVAGTTTVVPGALYKDGSYTGSVADAHWGNIQVRAIIQDGKITDVQFLQYPNERNRSIEINDYADPLLTQEAVQAQSAQVDIVTGATDTSEAFIQSLSDALVQARS